MGMTVQQRRQAGLFGKRFTASFGILALVALVISPAAAQPLGADIITSPGGAFDPCRFSPQISFAAESPSIGLGTSTNLNWSVKAPRGCGYPYSMIVLARPQIDLSPGAPQDWAIWTSSIGVPAQPQGSLPVQPAFNTVYMLIVAWGSAIHSAQIKVAVSLPLANPKCLDVANPSTSLMTAPTGGRAAGFTLVRPCRNRVTIDANNLAPLLVQALGTSNTTVIVADGVELDLTPYLGALGAPITIKDGVQLIGGRVAEPGKRFQPGPRLFVTPNPNVWDQSHWPNPLFQIMGDHIRISGVRIEGPGAPPDAWKNLPQPQGYTAAVRLYDKMYIEIDHNELDGWTTYALGVSGPEDIGYGENRAGRVWDAWTKRAWSDWSGIHYPVDPEPIWIHDNYFHDNFWGMPFLGYGVDMGLGGHALIERNVFDNHFHAIATDGNFGTGYRAYRNLAFHNEEQVFDMHGRRCPPAPAWSCPPGTPAAHDIDIRWNSFSRPGPPGPPAIKLMGTPELQPNGAVVQSNVFAHRSLGPDESSCHLGNPYVGDAVVMCGDGLLLGVGPLDNPTYNLLGVQSWFDPAHLSVSCDFDGDGINDSFITTGETWWFQSGDHRNGATPWVYLNTNTLLVENVSLGYFSTDAVRNHVCDVATIDGGYKGGTGQYGPLN